MRHIWKKGTKILAGVFVLTAVLCPPALAAEGWQKDGDAWCFVDGHGDRLRGQWKKADGEWYYFDSEGKMARSAWIDGESYVGEGGRRLASVWIAEPSPEVPDAEWYYIKENGKKAVEEDGWQKINGSFYLFDSDGIMKTGWQQWKDAVYYLRPDGRRVSGWKYLTLNLTDHEQFIHEDTGSDEEGWFWFSPGGVCCRSKEEKTINGKRYCFDQNGRMMSGWVLDGSWENYGAGGLGADISQYTYYGSGEDGGRVSGWIREEQPEGVGSDGDFYDYYLKNGKAYSVFDSDGNLRTRNLLYIEARADHQTGEGFAYQAVIGGKQYLFNHRGEVLFGLHPVFNQDGDLIGSCMADEKYGVLEKGRVKVKESSETKVDYYFDSSRIGVTGIKDDRAYYLGRIQAAEEDYRLISLPDHIGSNVGVDYRAYIVDEHGRIQVQTRKIYGTENAGEVILFPAPGGTGLSLYPYKGSREASDYDSADALIPNMSDCPDYMDALIEPDFE